MLKRFAHFSCDIIFTTLRKLTGQVLAVRRTPRPPPRTRPTPNSHQVSNSPTNPIALQKHNNPRDIQMALQNIEIQKSIPLFTTNLPSFCFQFDLANSTIALSAHGLIIAYQRNRVNKPDEVDTHSPKFFSQNAASVARNRRPLIHNVHIRRRYSCSAGTYWEILLRFSFAA